MTASKTTSDYNFHTIMPTKSSFTTTTFSETINWAVLIKYLFSEKILQEIEVHSNKTSEKKEFHQTERKMFEDILKLGMIVTKHKNKPIIDKKLLSLYFHDIPKYLKPSIKVKYFMSKNKLIGRVYPSNALSLGSMRRDLRGHLASDVYIDIDMVNCHSSLLNEVFGKKYPILNGYVADREKHFEMLGNYYNFDHKTEKGHDICKELFSRILYFGSYDTWEKDNNLEKKGKIAFMKELQMELNEIVKIIANDNPDIVELVKKYIERKIMNHDKEIERGGG
jgi:hypothetical protein